MKGIFFKPDMNLAIRERRKTVTRRVMKPQPRGDYPLPAYDKPRYLPGETVYVKEVYQTLGSKAETVYKADGNAFLTWQIGGKVGSEPVSKWRSPLFMPAKLARTFLIIKAVRPERLREITIQDVVAEGISPWSDSLNWVATTIEHYAQLWDSINTKSGTRWVDNPWVWRIEFEVKP